YDEQFFDAQRRVYFREDSDLGFRLEEAGARVVIELAAVVVHPEEHAGWLDPLAWAARHEMDPLLAPRPPARFRRMEGHRVGPLTVRRPIVGAAVICAIAAPLALLALGPWPQIAVALAAVALAALLLLWAKWGFSPARLPVVALVPFALSAALLR